MQKLVVFGRVLFAFGLIGLGGTHFAFQRFSAGRAPGAPEWFPGEVVWVYLAGVLFIAVGMALLTLRWARPALAIAAGVVFIWAFLRHLPVIASSPFLSERWTDASKSVRFLGGCLVVAAALPKVSVKISTLAKLLNNSTIFLAVGRTLLGLTLIMNGVQHFRFTEFVAGLIPGWFPGDAVVWTYLAGVALIAGGAGLIFPWTARLAALFSGSMVFSWFWIVHIPIATRSVSSGIALFEVLVTSGALLLTAGFLYSRGVGDPRGVGVAGEGQPTDEPAPAGAPPRTLGGEVPANPSS